MNSGASFSLDRRYRYRLWRTWDTAMRKTMVVIGLNPSTADETKDDPTIRRCLGFAKRERCGSLVMLNLFAFRSTSPHELQRRYLAGKDPVGPANDDAIVEACTLPNVLVVAAWGAYGTLRNRDDHVQRLLATADVWPRCFGFTKDGCPRHPLYLPSSTELVLVPA